MPDFTSASNFTPPLFWLNDVATQTRIKRGSVIADCTFGLPTSSFSVYFPSGWLSSRKRLIWSKIQSKNESVRKEKQVWSGSVLKYTLGYKRQDLALISFWIRPQHSSSEIRQNICMGLDLAVTSSVFLFLTQATRNDKNAGWTTAADPRKRS